MGRSARLDRANHPSRRLGSARDAGRGRRARTWRRRWVSTGGGRRDADRRGDASASCSSASASSCRPRDAGAGWGGDRAVVARAGRRVRGLLAAWPGTRRRTPTSSLAAYEAVVGDLAFPAMVGEAAETRSLIVQASTEALLQRRRRWPTSLHRVGGGDPEQGRGRWRAPARVASTAQASRAR